MITTENAENEYVICQSCKSNNSIKVIKIGLSERQTITIRLCKKCRDELIDKIKNI